MKTWNVSQQHLESLHKWRTNFTIIFTVIMWSFAVYVYTPFSKDNIADSLMRSHPGVATLIGGQFILFLILPLFTFFIFTRIVNRSKITQVFLTEDRLIKQIGHEKEEILLTQLFEIRTMRLGSKNILKKAWLMTQRGAPMLLEGLEDFEGFLLTLKSAVPSCPIKEQKIPQLVGRICLLFFILWVPLSILLLQGHMSSNAFCVIGILFLVVLWFATRSCRPVCQQEERLFSSLLGARYRWLDFAFAGVVFYLLASAIGQGMEAIQDGTYSDLLSIFFVPIILTWLFLVPLWRRIRINKSDRWMLASVFIIVLGLHLIEGQPSRASKDFRKARRHFEAKRYEQALPYLEESYRHDPRNQSHAEYLAYAYSKTRQYQEAMNILENLIQSSNGSSDYAWELLPYVCRQTGEWQRLLNIAETSIDVDPDSASGYRAAGLAASQIYGLRSEEARQYYKKYLELNSNPKETAFVKELFPDL